MQSYDNRMMELVKTIDSIAFKKMDERLFEYLEAKSKAFQTKELSVTHQDIAFDLNASREAISRLLKKMEKEGMLTLGRNKINLR
jgi:CRP/FNR family transcriptional regulator